MCDVDQNELKCAPRTQVPCVCRVLLTVHDYFVVIRCISDMFDFRGPFISKTVGCRVKLTKIGPRGKYWVYTSTFDCQVTLGVTEWPQCHFWVIRCIFDLFLSFDKLVCWKWLVLERKGPKILDLSGNKLVYAGNFWSLSVQQNSGAISNWCISKFSDIRQSCLYWPRFWLSGVNT